MARCRSETISRQLAVTLLTPKFPFLQIRSPSGKARLCRGHVMEPGRRFTSDANNESQPQRTGISPPESRPPPGSPNCPGRGTAGRFELLAVPHKIAV